LEFLFKGFFYSQQTMKELVKLNKAQQALAEAKSLDEIIPLVNIGAGGLAYARAAKMGLEMQNDCAEFKIRAERKAGEFLRETELSKGAAEKKTRLHDATTLSDLGIEKTQSHRWQKIASVPNEEFESHIKETKQRKEELTSASIIKIVDKPHIVHNSGENEWYTPEEFIKSARVVLGNIDLDPASSEEANKVVGADIFFTLENSGLTKRWFDKVWMNPPYSSDLIGLFTEKFAQHFNNKDISEGIVLVNNATETVWFQVMTKVASSLCFPKTRIKYWSPNKESSTPLQGQAFLYFGFNSVDFKSEFKQYGFCCDL